MTSTNEKACAAVTGRLQGKTQTSHATNYKPVAYRTQTYADFGINVPAISCGEWRTTCPLCSSNRKKANDRCLSVNVTKGTWYCHHCQFTGGLSDKSPDDLRRIENHRAQQSEIDLALIVVEIAKTERDRGVQHSASDLETIRKSVAKLKNVPPSQRKLSQPRPSRDLSIALDLALREGREHIAFETESTSLCDECGSVYVTRNRDTFYCAVCAGGVS